MKYILPYTAAIDRLGFLEVKQQIKTYCLSDMGRELVEQMQPVNNYYQINKFLHQTSEFARMLQGEAPFSIRTLPDIRPVLLRIKEEGTFLNIQELYEIWSSLKTAFFAISYFKTRKEAYPHLQALVERFFIRKDILSRIEQVIDAKGRLKPSASKALYELVNSLSTTRGESLRRLTQIYNEAKRMQWTSMGNLTLRQGRLCIPLLAKERSKLKGNTYGESASGEVIFIEPEEIFEINNLAQKLEQDKAREEAYVLASLTDDLRPHIYRLMTYHNLLIRLDFIQAKAKYAIDTKAQMPKLIPKRALYLTNAQHPLAMPYNSKEAASFTINFKSSNDALEIPNLHMEGTFGYWRTAGLLQLMVQAGLLIPVDKDSKTGIFKQILIS